MFGPQRKDSPIFAPHFVLFRRVKLTRQVWESAPGFKINFTTVERAATDEMPGRFFCALNVRFVTV
jgi:hypothetical protein